MGCSTLVGRILITWTVEFGLKLGILLGGTPERELGDLLTLNLERFAEDGLTFNKLEGRFS